MEFRYARIRNSSNSLTDFIDVFEVKPRMGELWNNDPQAFVWRSFVLSTLKANKGAREICFTSVVWS